MKVSIVVPNFNHGRFLAACIESILGQSYRNYEAFIYDNKSIDNSVAVARAYAAKDSRIRLLQAPIHTTSAAAGITKAMTSYASGDIGIWINSDDELLEHALDAIVPYFVDPMVGFVRTGIIAVTTYSDKEDRIETVLPMPIYRLRDCLNVNLVYPECPFRRQLFLDVGGLDENARFYDWDFWIKCCLACDDGKWTYKDHFQPTVVRRIHGLDPGNEESEQRLAELGQGRGANHLEYMHLGSEYIRRKYESM